jgi:hypothetical protein
MKINRVISVYEKKGEALVREIELNGVPLEKLKQIFSAPADDKELYDVYPINTEVINELIFFIPELIELDLNTVDLYYECYSE